MDKITALNERKAVSTEYKMQQVGVLLLVTQLFTRKPSIFKGLRYGP